MSIKTLHFKFKQNDLFEQGAPLTRELWQNIDRILPRDPDSFSAEGVSNLMNEKGKNVYLRLMNNGLPVFVGEEENLENRTGLEWERLNILKSFFALWFYIACQQVDRGDKFSVWVAARIQRWPFLYAGWKEIGETGKPLPPRKAVMDTIQNPGRAEEYLDGILNILFSNQGWELLANGKTPQIDEGIRTRREEIKKLCLLPDRLSKCLQSGNTAQDDISIRKMNVQDEQLNQALVIMLASEVVHGIKTLEGEKMTSNDFRFAVEDKIGLVLGSFGGYDLGGDWKDKTMTVSMMVSGAIRGKLGKCVRLFKGSALNKVFR